MKFNWVTLHVKNMEKSLRFYQDIVKLPLARRFPSGPDSEIAFLGDEGQAQVELICSAADRLSGMTNDISLGFAVESVDEMMTFVQSKGIGIHSGPFQPGPNIRFFYCLDPDGLKVQFAESL